jgi:endonuclease III
LAELYPEARISLDFATPWQCLVATILSAQCTDERVNRTTPELFRRLPDVSAIARAPLEEVQRLIQSTFSGRSRGPCKRRHAQFWNILMVRSPAGWRNS